MTVNSRVLITITASSYELVNAAVNDLVGRPLMIEFQSYRRRISFSYSTYERGAGTEWTAKSRTDWPLGIERELKFELIALQERHPQVFVGGFSAGLDCDEDFEVQEVSGVILWSKIVGNIDVAARVLYAFSESDKQERSEPSSSI